MAHIFCALWAVVVPTMRVRLIIVHVDISFGARDILSFAQRTICSFSGSFFERFWTKVSKFVQAFLSGNGGRSFSVSCVGFPVTS